MGWKQLSSWLKGGIILSSFYIIVYLIFLIIKIIMPCENSGLFGFCSYELIFLLFSIPGLAISSFLRIENSQNNILFLIITILLYFIIGAAIGSIIGKIKNKRPAAVKK